MNFTKIIELANDSGGTLYLMCVLLLVALTVIFERTRHLSNMQQGGESLIALLRENVSLHGAAAMELLQKHAHLPHARLFSSASDEPESADRDTIAGHLEEALMHEVPSLDRSLWMLDTVITLAPLMGLFGTIIGMFNAFRVLGDIQNGAAQITGGIAEALIATASGLFIAMIGLVFFNGLNTRVRAILHQLETIKVMLINRRHAVATKLAAANEPLVRAAARA
jgi:biopolymer transport protein ExbB